MKLIAFAGYQGSGKSLAASYLSNYPKTYLTKFAGTLKQVASIIYHVPIDYWEYDKNTKQERLQNKTKREVLQIIGTEALRNNLSDDIWIYSLDLELKELATKKQIDIVIIDDLRFPNELQFIKQNNGLVAYINRELEIKDKHESESYYELIKSQANLLVKNTSHLSNLYKQLDSLIDYLNS